jgi:transcriptional regulator with XRE-family HTH domain
MTPPEVSPADVASEPSEEAAAPETPAADPEKLPTVGEIVRLYREKRKMTQLELANKMGHRTPEWAGMLENGYRSLDLERAPLMADALLIDPRDFTKHVLYEYFPKAAEALFDEPFDPKGIRETKRPRTAQLAPPTYEMAQLYENLPRQMQDSILHLVTSMADICRVGVRDRHSRPIPVRRLGQPQKS